jgi:hypothetical protein
LQPEDEDFWNTQGVEENEDEDMESFPTKPGFRWYTNSELEIGMMIPIDWDLEEQHNDITLSEKESETCNNST